METDLEVPSPGPSPKGPRAAGMARGALQVEVRCLRQPADPPLSSSARQGASQGGTGLKTVTECDRFRAQELAFHQQCGSGAGERIALPPRGELPGTKIRS